MRLWGMSRWVRAAVSLSKRVLFAMARLFGTAASAVSLGRPVARGGVWWSGVYSTISRRLCLLPGGLIPTPHRRDSSDLVVET